MSKQFHVTLNITDETSLLVCDILQSTNELGDLISFLVDAEIPKYAGMEVQSEPEPVEVSQKLDSNITDNLLSILYDIKETVEELKDISTDTVKEEKPVDNSSMIVGIKDEIMSAIKGIKRVEAVPSTQTITQIQDSVPVEPVPVEIKPVKMGIQPKGNMANRLSKLKSMKGG